jgi:hypothetical protein
MSINFNFFSKFVNFFKNLNKKSITNANKFNDKLKQNFRQINIKLAPILSSNLNLNFIKKEREC